MGNTDNDERKPLLGDDVSASYTIKDTDTRLVEKTISVPSFG